MIVHEAINLTEKKLEEKKFKTTSNVPKQRGRDENWISHHHRNNSEEFDGKWWEEFNFKLFVVEVSTLENLVEKLLMS